MLDAHTIFFRPPPPTISPPPDKLRGRGSIPPIGLLCPPKNSFDRYLFSQQFVSPFRDWCKFLVFEMKHSKVLFQFFNTSAALIITEITSLLEKSFYFSSGEESESSGESDNQFYGEPEDGIEVTLYSLRESGNAVSDIDSNESDSPTAREY